MIEKKLSWGWINYFTVRNLESGKFDPGRMRQGRKREGGTVSLQRRCYTRQLLGSNVETIRNNMVTMLQHSVALKIVVTNRRV